ncbi:hypothetical protein ABZY44_37505 [Streptomyces sp. NPDC006544]|uniref:hypothetical protein n=1 Tax=Streptomyces sp. NPDC006544 TaxID=3154583 RepID=UPI0033AD3B58
MKLKRIAVVAVAAVVGPTVLMVTPAMADEVKNPAVTAPDAAPNDDTAQTRAGTGQESPWAPTLSFANAPKSGFAAGSDWSEFTVKVDNTAGPSVAGYSLELSVTGSRLRSSYFDVEVFYAGAWHQAARAALPGPDAPVYDATPGLTYGADSVTDVKMRMRAKAEAPAADITVAVTGTDHRDADSKAASFASKVTHAQTGDGDGTTAGAPQLSLDGLPAKGFTAGADWSAFSLHVDNTGRRAVDDYSLEMVLWTLDTLGFEDGDAQLEVYAPDAAGTWGWHKVDAYGSEEAWSFSLAEVDIEQNEVFDLKLRMKFAKDAPATRLSLDTTAEGGSAPRAKHGTTLTAADQQAERQGPKLGLDGLPQAGFTAGGDWQQLALHVDNSGKEAIDKYTFVFFLFPDGKNVLKAKHFDIEAWNGTAWVPLAKDPLGQEPGAIFHWAVGKNAKFDIQLRVRAAADTPDSPILAILYGDSNGSAHPVESDMVVKHTSVHGAATGGGSGTGSGSGSGTGTGSGTGNNGGNQPAPDGGAEPVDM